MFGESQELIKAMMEMFFPPRVNWFEFEQKPRSERMAFIEHPVQTLEGMLVLILKF